MWLSPLVRRWRTLLQSGGQVLKKCRSRLALNKCQSGFSQTVGHAYQACLSVMFLPYLCILPHTCHLRQVHCSRHCHNCGFQLTWLCQLHSLRLTVKVLDTLAAHSKFSCKESITAAITIITGTHFSNFIGFLSNGGYSLSWLPLPTKS